jgi:hypothetical protein
MGVEKNEDARDGALLHHCAPRKATKELGEREDPGLFKGRNACTIPMVGPVSGPFCSGVPDQAVQRWELLLGPMRAEDTLVAFAILTAGGGRFIEPLVTESALSILNADEVPNFTGQY